jgi:hypothetical protein
VEATVSQSNEGEGLSVGTGSAVAGCQVLQNGGDGILFRAPPLFHPPAGSVIGSVVWENLGNGIASQGGFFVTQGGILVSQNSVSGNSLHGLSMPNSAYGGNLITSNIGGTATGTALINLGANGCFDSSGAVVACP